MPKLRAINLSLLKNGSVEEAKRVAKDLLILTPRGAAQNLRAKDYVKHDDYPGKDAYVEGSCEDRWNRTYTAAEYGYTPEILYYTMKNLGAQGRYIDEWRSRNILAHHFDMHGAKLTRSSRRLSKRVSRAWKEAISSGVLGDLTYSISVQTPPVGADRWGRGHSTSANIKFAASSESEARSLLTAMFTHAIDTERLDNWEAWKVAEASEVMSENIGQVNRLKEKRAEIEKSIADLREHLERIETLEEAITMYSLTACGEDN